MRVKSFLLFSDTYVGDGSLDSFGENITDSNIQISDVTFQSAIPYHDTTDEDPYGNINIYVSSKTISSELISLQVGKSSSSPGTTDRVDIIVLSARG